MNVTLIGTGLLGSAIAIRLQECGHQLTVWNRSQEKCNELRTHGIRIATDASKAIAASPVTLLLLSDALAITEVLDRLPNNALNNKTVIQMGTIAPEESRTLARHIAGLKARYLEAPVLGSLPEARSGELQIMAGGDEKLFQELLPLLEDLDYSPRRVGAVGQAAAMKLALNQLIASLTTSFSLSLGLVRAEGIEVEQFMELLRDSALYAPTFDKKLAKYLSDDYSKPNFPLRHLIKDTALFADAAAQHHMDRRLLDSMLDIFQSACSAGHCDEDYSALYLAINPRPH